MKPSAKARAVYRAIEKAQSNGLIGLNKAKLSQWCLAAHGMTPAQVDAGIDALMDGEMLHYRKTVVMDRMNGFVYRIVDVAVLADRNAFQRDVDARSRYAITHGRRTKTKVRSFIDDAVAQGDIARAMHLAKIQQRADDLVAEAHKIQQLVATL
jgi:hypothetical protein